MIITITIFTITCILLIISILFKPDVRIKKITLPLYPIITLFGAIFLILFTPLSFDVFLSELVKDTSVNPIKIVVLFISLSMISIFLDEAGFFEYLALLSLSKCKGSQKKLFSLLYLTISILTIFTSNDIIILTFTPFIISFCKNAKINPIPYLIAEFASANTFSMFLLIGNPTNIYLASSQNISFLEYFQVMFIPTLITGIEIYILLFCIFRKKLSKIDNLPLIEIKLKDKTDCIVGSILLIACTISLMLSNYLNFEMWIECFFFALLLFIITIIIALFHHRKPIILVNTIKRAPWPLIPFVFSMFALVLGLKICGSIEIISSILSKFDNTLGYGISSFLIANVINNIPMSILYTSIIDINMTTQSIYATIIGSNLCALCTPVGALAGIMFTHITKQKNESFSSITFIKYGSIISIIALITCLSTLKLIL